MTDKFKYLRGIVAAGLGAALFLVVFVPQADPLNAMLVVIGALALTEFIVMACAKIARAAIAKAKGEK